MSGRCRLRSRSGASRIARDAGAGSIAGVLRRRAGLHADDQCVH